MSFQRLETSRSRLNIDWDRPWSKPDQNPADFASAIRYLAEYADGKPILIQRSSGKHDKKTQRLLAEALKSERFQLASKWFHCLQVGDEVLQKKHHLFHAFRGKNPPAFILATPDGKHHARFLGTSSQKVRWEPIARILRNTYAGNPTKSVKGLEKLLCTFDALDARRTELQQRLARAKTRSKRKELEAKLKKAAKAREVALADEKKLRDLALKAEAKKKAGAKKAG